MWEWEGMKEKVVVLRELHRAIIYTIEMSKQVTDGHVSTVFIAYQVSEGARLTSNITKMLPCLHPLRKRYISDSQYRDSHIKNWSHYRRRKLHVTRSIFMHQIENIKL
jgi:hypothetical protein